nr:MAG TPA: hypothetical protein [Caudoviricetes sp.]
MKKMKGEDYPILIFSSLILSYAYKYTISRTIC